MEMKPFLSRRALDCWRAVTVDDPEIWKSIWIQSFLRRHSQDCWRAATFEDSELSRFINTRNPYTPLTTDKLWLFGIQKWWSHIYIYNCKCRNNYCWGPRIIENLIEYTIISEQARPWLLTGYDCWRWVQNSCNASDNATISEQTRHGLPRGSDGCEVKVIETNLNVIDSSSQSRMCLLVKDYV